MTNIATIINFINIVLFFFRIQVQMVLSHPIIWGKWYDIFYNGFYLLCYNNVITYFLKTYLQNNGHGFIFLSLQGIFFLNVYTLFFVRSFYILVCHIYIYLILYVWL